MSPMPMPPYCSPMVTEKSSARRSASSDDSANSSVSSQWAAFGASSRSATSRASFRSAAVLVLLYREVRAVICIPLAGANAAGSGVWT